MLAVFAARNFRGAETAQMAKRSNLYRWQLVMAMASEIVAERLDEMRAQPTHRLLRGWQAILTVWESTKRLT